MQIDDGDKYALVGFEVNLDEALQQEQVTPDLWVLTAASFDIPPEWRGWLGSMRSDEVASCNLFLASKLASGQPGTLNEENQTLQQRVWHFYIGLLLSAMFSPAHKPVMLTGARQDGVTDIRELGDLEVPSPQIFRRYPSINAADILLAAQLGQKLNAMRPEIVPGGLWRFLRTLHIYVETRSLNDLLDRIHQYCRCIDGLILPAIGRTKQHFKSRTELFIGPGHHDLMDKLYDIRSHVEHLHENRYLETFDRNIRLDLVKKEAIVEYIARKAIARIVSQEELWPHFGNTAALERFWELSLDERQRNWGVPVDPMTPVTDFDPDHLSDELLGKV